MSSSAASACRPLLPFLVPRGAALDVAPQDMTEQAASLSVLETPHRRLVAGSLPKPIYRVLRARMASAEAVALVGERLLLNKEVDPGGEVLAVVGTVISAATAVARSDTVAMFPLIALPSIHGGAVDDALTVLPRSANSGV